MKKVVTLALASALFGGLTVNSAMAFSDVGAGQAEAISSLQARGIVSGIDQDRFDPKGNLTYAQSVQMIVKGLGLNLDLLRFFKQPLATDIFSGIANDAWYAEAFIIAHYSGLDIPKDVNPNATMTREQFGDLLIRALEKQGEFPMIKIAIDVKDADQITPEYQGALLRMLVYKIAALDQDGNLHPKSLISRGEAATWLYNAGKVLEVHQQAPAVAEKVAVVVEKVNDEINKVTLTRESKPTGGYGITVTGIRFESDGQAVITYALSDPQPDSMNAAAITEPQAVAYVPAAYKKASAEPMLAN